MSLRFFNTTLVLLLAAGASAAHARPAPTAENGDRNAPADVARLTPRQLMQQTDQRLQEMRVLLADVQKLLDGARADKDVVRLNCVNEKFAQVKGLIRVGEQSSTGLQDAVGRGNLDRARHEFTKAAVARDRAQQLRVAAEECLGQTAFVLDEDLQVDVEVPEDLPPDEPVVPDVPPVVVRPPPASPAE